MPKPKTKAAPPKRQLLSGEILASEVGASTREIRPTYGSVTGYVCSLKCGRPVPFESLIERNIILLVETDPRVIRFKEQPLTLFYAGPDGRTRSYTTDLLIYFRDCPPLLVEVKYTSDLALPADRDPEKEKAKRRKHDALFSKLKVAQEYARRQGWDFCVLTEKHAHRIAVNNARVLRRYQRVAVNEKVEQTLLSLLEDLQQTSPRELLAEVGSASSPLEVLSALWQMYLRGGLGADLTSPIDLDTPLWMVDREGRGDASAS